MLKTHFDLENKFVVKCADRFTEREPMYISELVKSCSTEILETLAKFNTEGHPIWKPVHIVIIHKNIVLIVFIK